MRAARGLSRLAAIGLAVCVVSFVGGVGAAAELGESAAIAKAIGILKGDPYGNSTAAVRANIKSAQLVANGRTKACGSVKGAVWEFHVVVVTKNKDQFNNGVIDGYLALDARSGKIKCTNLPLLD